MPKRVSSDSCIVLPTDATIFTLRANNIQILPSFHGLKNENPYGHIRAFEYACFIYLDGKVTKDVVYLKLFSLFH